MAKLKVAYPRTGTWAEFNEKLVRLYKLPHGSRFGLTRSGGRPSTRPYVRSDTEVRRKPIRIGQLPKGSGTHVSDVCQHIESMLAPASRASVAAIDPNGVRLHGNTLLRTWEGMAGKPTQEEKDAAEARRRERDQLSHLASRQIMDLEEGIEDPSDLVPEAVLLALTDRFGNKLMREAVERLRLS